MNFLLKPVLVPLFFMQLKIPVLLLLGILLLTTGMIAASIGAVSIPLTGIIGVNLTDQQEAVLTSIRLPRILLAVIVGGSLAVSGAAKAPHCPEGKRPQLLVIAEKSQKTDTRRG